MGRILNRFSKDIESIDDSLPSALQTAAWSASEIVAVIVVIGYTNPILIPWFLPLGIFPGDVV